jgi:hypothetical protein
VPWATFISAAWHASFSARGRSTSIGFGAKVAAPEDRAPANDRPMWMAVCTLVAVALIFGVEAGPARLMKLLVQLEERNRTDIELTPPGGFHYALSSIIPRLTARSA